VAVRTFHLPDLGEGLQEAEIVAWHVKEGDRVRTDQPLASVETAKAVVDVPAPWSGRIAKIHAAAGTILATHAPLVDIEEEGSAPTSPKPAAKTAEPDSGTVVGRMPSAGGDLEETMIVRRRPTPAAPPSPAPPAAPPPRTRVSEPSRGPVKALPRVRRLARERGIDLAGLSGSGPRGAVTLRDLEAAPAARPESLSSVAPARPSEGESRSVRGPRRAMAQTMALARDTVAATTLFDDADIDAWAKDEDITVRVIRALAAGVREVPILNAWYDGEKLELTVCPRLDLGLAVDTPDGLIVPVVRDAGGLDRRARRARRAANKTDRQRGG
jgi:2-oxoisovalerate dehydrogenase E2 component (dihydrolipoyl transacylase)